MLIVYTILLVIASVFVLSARRSKEFVFLFGCCVSLLFEFVGILIYVAKIGGYPQRTLKFLYLSMSIKTNIQYMIIPYEKMGFLYAIGRYMFPMFLILLAYEYSAISFIHKNKWHKIWLAVIPFLSLVLYYPSIYKWLLLEYANMDIILFYFTKIWIYIYIGISLSLFVIELISISMKYYKSRFLLFIIGIVALAVLYSMYCSQDPGQIYCMYRNEYSYSLRGGLSYLKYGMSSLSFGIVSTISIICCAVGFYGIMRYAGRIYIEDIEEKAISNKFDTVHVGASMFVHSMKNQFLSNEIILKKMILLSEEKEISVNEIKKYTEMMYDINSGLLKRVEELNRLISTNKIYMFPIEVNSIVNETLQRVKRKYPEEDIEVEINNVQNIVVDKDCFCEALYNLLINGIETIFEAKNANLIQQGYLKLSFRNEHLKTIVEVTDNGMGMSKKQQKNIYNPFYSSKNSNYNWGMGLYFVRKVIKGHMGKIRIESKPGDGTRIIITLPKCNEWKVKKL